MAIECTIEGLIPEAGGFTEKSSGTIIKLILDPASAAKYYAFLMRSRQMNIPTFKANFILTTPEVYGIKS